MKHVPAKSAHRVAAVAVALISVAVAMAVIVADVGLTTEIVGDRGGREQLLSDDFTSES
jgi:hypothetical protein